MLYVATADELPLTSSPDLTIEAVDDARRAVDRWFSYRNVRFIGAHTGCSCGFPSVIAESPIEYFEGIWDDHGDREDDLRSVGALLDLLRRIVERSSSVELYPVWDGDQALAPKGVIAWQAGTLVPERFFFNQRFMHIVRR
ncbi:MAG TPA: hypothetical protein VIR54_30055 [Vicinamibacterales bacterium]|jgi:hypothetical protein